MSRSDLLDAYRRAAMGHRAANIAGDYRKGNPQADIVTNVYRELRRRGEQRILLILLDDEDPGVRVWTARFALEIEPAMAIPVLEALARSEPASEAFSAEMTLRLWRKGELGRVP